MEEKMMILNMLQEGKITAEEAAKLLEAIEKGKANDADYANRRNNLKLDEKMNKLGEKASKLAEQFTEKANKLAEQFTENVNNNKGKINDAERFASDFSKRMEVVGSEIAESAVKFADRLVSQLGGIFDVSGEKCKITSNYIYPVTGTPNINIDTHNFTVKVNTTDTQNIALNMYVNSDILDISIDEFFKADINGDSFSFTTNFPGRTWGNIELLVPKTVGELNITTENAKCELNDLFYDVLKCRTSNAKITCSNCHGKTAEAVTNNGKISLEDFSARAAVMHTSNSKLELERCKLDTLEAMTSNGAIQLFGIGKLEAAEARYDLNTSNGRIAIELDKNEDYGYMVDAYTSLGGIHITLPEMSYFVDKKSSSIKSTAMVKSTNFDSAENKVFIKANTSNAAISIESK